MKTIAYYLMVVPLTVLEFALNVLIFPCALLIGLRWWVYNLKSSLQDPTERSDVGSWEREEEE